MLVLISFDFHIFLIFHSALKAPLSCILMSVDWSIKIWVTAPNTNNGSFTFTCLEKKIKTNYGIVSLSCVAGRFILGWGIFVALPEQSPSRVQAKDVLRIEHNPNILRDQTHASWCVKWPPTPLYFLNTTNNSNWFSINLNNTNYRNWFSINFNATSHRNWVSINLNTTSHSNWISIILNNTNKSNWFSINLTNTNQRTDSQSILTLQIIGTESQPELHKFQNAHIWQDWSIKHRQFPIQSRVLI